MTGLPVRCSTCNAPMDGPSDVATALGNCLPCAQRAALGTANDARQLSEACAAYSREEEGEPLVLGGQGRDADEIAADGGALAGFVGVSLLLALGAVIGYAICLATHPQQ